MIRAIRYGLSRRFVAARADRGGSVAVVRVSDAAVSLDG